MAVRIDRKKLILDLAVAEPVLKKEAERVVREQYFEPAIKVMKQEFEQHVVTQEIRAGIKGTNVSQTLEAPFGEPPIRKDGRESQNYSPPNLFSFIGFPAGTNPLQAIEERLDPANPDGPKLKYKSMNKQDLTFRFEVSTPSLDKIYKATPLPWAAGLSWVWRIERGLPGIGFFLNALHRKGSRSGGGIQVDHQLRPGRFKATSYLTSIFKAFLDRVSKLPGR